MGPSGSGKSTLLNLAGGLDAPTQGEVVVEGAVLGSAQPQAAGRGAPAQRRLRLPGPQPAAQPDRGWRTSALPLELDGMSLRKTRGLALAALDEVGLAELAPRFPDEMSGGQQQRVAIARALVGDRRLVLADEPTGALDSQTGEAVLKLLRARVDAGAAGVLVTHEARHAAWADRVVFLRDGEIVDTSGPLDPARGAAARRAGGAAHEPVVSSWRTALRIARREARRSKGRSALVVAMIALPVLVPRLRRGQLRHVHPDRRPRRPTGPWAPPTPGSRGRSHGRSTRTPTATAYGSPQVAHASRPPEQHEARAPRPRAARRTAARQHAPARCATGPREVHTADGRRPAQRDRRSTRPAR